MLGNRNDVPFSKALIEKSEQANRLKEYNSSYQEGLRLFGNEYEAGLYAAGQARDLLDFAVAGHTVRVLNQLFPFTNAHVQGLRRTFRALTRGNKDHANKQALATFTTRFFMYAVIPSLMARDDGSCQR